MEDSLSLMMQQIQDFRDKREWKQFHNKKDMALSLFIEVAELTEHLQWKSEEEFNLWLESHKSEFADELSDVLYWVLLFALDCNIDLPLAFASKMKQNIEKYPLEKAKGKKEKYHVYKD